MSKKHKHHQQQQPRGAPPARQTGGPGRSHGVNGSLSGSLPARVERIQELLDEERWVEALPLLDALVAREGRHAPDVWRMLAFVHQSLGLWEPLEQSAARVVELAPNDPMALLALATTHLRRDHSAMALQALRRFLARWPVHTEAEYARQLEHVLEEDLTIRLGYSSLTLEQGIEPSIQHERALTAMEQQQYVEARHLEEQALRLAPSFMPALNTISLVYFLEGRQPQAISAARRVLDRDPANVHALGNLIRFLVLSGQREETLALAPRLRDAPLLADEAWVKKAEAWTYLGDDAALVDLLASLERNGKLPEDLAHPLGLHLVAVAAWRLGHPHKARALWRRALALDPAFDLAQMNLVDLAKPVAERNAPWAYTVNYWIDERVMRALRELADEVGKPGVEERVQRSLRTLLTGHPELANLVPTLLERGDPAGRRLALEAALAADTPEMRLALRDFALGQYGPDELRVRAAETIARAGLLPGHKARLWLKGKWVELLLYAYAVTDEPGYSHPPAVEALEERGMDAMHAKRYAEAEQLYREALVLLPGAPEIQNNLAAAISNQGRYDEADMMVDVIFAEHPDYLFARLGKARTLIHRGDLLTARALIDPMLERTQLHVSELRMICRTQIDYYLAERNHEAADTWLTIWQQGELDPDAAEDEWMRYQIQIGLMRIQSRQRGPRKATGKTTKKRKPAPKTWMRPEPPRIVDALPATPPPTPPPPSPPAPRLLSAMQDEGDTLG
ncbi:MAG TPA: tetratricopeptide repeat protein [Ktedonobacterales bacterium]